MKTDHVIIPWWNYACSSTTSTVFFCTNKSFQLLIDPMAGWSVQVTHSERPPFSYISMQTGNSSEPRLKISLQIKKCCITNTLNDSEEEISFILRKKDNKHYRWQQRRYLLHWEKGKFHLWTILFPAFGLCELFRLLQFSPLYNLLTLLDMQYFLFILQMYFSFWSSVFHRSWIFFFFYLRFLLKVFAICF